MTLDKASQSYAGASRNYNPLWKRIYEPFLRSLDGAPDMYVSERISTDGVTERDVVSHVEADSKTPLVIMGPAGVGKTTFLEQALRVAPRADATVIWVDVLRIAEPDPDARYRGVEAAIGERLELLATRNKQEFEPLWRYLLQHWSDARGKSSVLLNRVLNGTPMHDEGFAHDLFALLGEMTFLESARLRIAYIRETARKLPVVVLDNSDRLPLSLQRRVLQLALALATGSRRPTPVPDSGQEPAQEPGHERMDYAVVIATMRPETLAQVNPQQSVGQVKTGELKPPVMTLVLQMRLRDFFGKWPDRVVGNPAFSDAHGRGADLRDIARDIGLSHDADLESFARELLQNLTESLTAGSGREGLTDLIHRATNYNTRRSLLGLAHYVASGHHDWIEIAKKTSAGQSSAGPGLSWHKRFRALLLGTRALYSTRESWLINLFNDAPRETVVDEDATASEERAEAAAARRSAARPRDEIGVLIQLRIALLLRGEVAALGIRIPELSEHIERLFGYDPQRSADTVLMLADSGLIAETSPERYGLTEAGRTYLDRIVLDFEYLQHVIIDTFVAREYLVPCLHQTERASLRFERVLRFAEWVQTLEAADFERLVSAGRAAEYARYYGQETITGLLAAALARVSQELPRVGDSSALNHQLRDLQQRAAYAHMLSAAQATRSSAPGA